MTFDEWWKQNGKFCRAGGDSYEKALSEYVWEVAMAEKQAAQEPVGWYDTQHKDFSRVCRIGWIPLYTAPQPASADVERALDSLQDTWLNSRLHNDSEKALLIGALDSVRAAMAKGGVS